jgi:hypothetical protein
MKSALPAITALVAPTPAIWMIFTRRPYFAHSPNSSAMKFGVDVKVKFGMAMVMSSNAAGCAPSGAVASTRTTAARAAWTARFIIGRTRW